MCPWVPDLRDGGYASSRWRLRRHSLVRDTEVRRYARGSGASDGFSAGVMSGSEGLLVPVATVILSWVARMIAVSAIKAKAAAATQDHTLISST
jgi:hypothetical protein